ncbi:nitroreductase family protein [Frankia sp. AgKG'84/4]|uniref:nitroreductase family protein n=1 Tax=Frankia sp. AgKG'84/4 TaxID=573490 RepID=UPI00200D2361|nr:nitroreductase family protein [Frankia sp. AgKG'84/4]MCL9793380.1 nitroreductase family protein [Frankia sp. AgKG'84/4]
MSRLDLSSDDLLQTTRAVRRRLDLDRPVERDVLERCLALAVQAPTGRNRQRWDFVLVTDDAVRAGLAELYRLGLTRPREHIARTGVDRTAGEALAHQRMSISAQHLFDNLHRVPVLLVPCLQVADRRETASNVGQANAWGSILPAVWSFMLAARTFGIGTAWTTPHLHYEREAADLLGIPYERTIQAALIPVAYTVGTDFRPGPRVDVGAVTHWNHW